MPLASMALWRAIRRHVLLDLDAEPGAGSESPALLGCDTCTIRLSLPEDRRDKVMAPYRAAYGLSSGTRHNRSLSGALQWRASARLNFVLEGSYFGGRSAGSYASLFLRTRENYYTLQNVRYASDGALLGYDIFNLPDDEGELKNHGRLTTGFDGGRSEGSSHSYRTNLETHYAVSGLSIDVSAQYQWGDTQGYSNGHSGEYFGLTQARIDFDSPHVANNGPYFSFNVSPTDASLGRITGLRDNISAGKNNSVSTQVDIRKDLSRTGLLRVGRFGARYVHSDNQFSTSYRNANWQNPETEPLLTSVVGIDPVTIAPRLPSGSPMRWTQLDSDQLFARWPEVTAFIIANRPDELVGPGSNRGVAAHFADRRPDIGDPVNVGRTTENVFAAYASLGYGFEWGLPFDGEVGLRYVNTFASMMGSNIRIGAQIYDEFDRPTGKFFPNVYTLTSVRGNYIDLLPSAFINVALAEKLKLRGSYSHNVQRPGLYSLRNFLQFNYANPNDPVYAGNPDLKPTRTDDFNLALEWYFGRGGIISLGGFSKNQKGFIYETRQQEFVPEFHGLHYVVKPRNAGPGQTQGFEFQATSFFTFLPGVLRNLGVTANATWIPTADLYLPAESEEEEETGVIHYELVKKRAPYVSRWSYNVIGYYESKQFSTRIAYNWRSTYQTGVDAIDENNIVSDRATSRLDAAINYTPVKFLTVSIEGTNLLNVIDKNYYYLFPDLPTGLNSMSRRFTLGARFRF
ncbi:TonB-dependent receptor [Sphingomonas sp. BK235]|nr:TonB-dependent receptor [Sphingomonas sp. BK235]